MLRKIEYISLFIFVLAFIFVDSFDYLINFLHLQANKYLYLKTFVHDYIEYFSLVILSILSFYLLAVKRDIEQLGLSLLSAISLIILPIMVYFSLKLLINVYDRSKSLNKYSKIIKDNSIPIKKRAMLSKFLAHDIYISKHKVVKIINPNNGKLIDYNPTKKDIQTSNRVKYIQAKITRLKYNIWINIVIVVISFFIGLMFRKKYKKDIF